MSAVEAAARTSDSDRSASYETDPLVRVIEDTIRAEPAQRRLYPDLYAETLAERIRADAAAPTADRDTLVAKVCPCGDQTTHNPNRHQECAWAETLVGLTLDALLAEGLLATRPEREIVTTAEELDALPTGSVIRSREEGTVWLAMVTPRTKERRWGTFQTIPSETTEELARWGDTFDVLHRATSIESEAGERQ